MGERDRPAPDEHDLTYKRSARKCHDCHKRFPDVIRARNVTDHILQDFQAHRCQYSNYNMVYCANCHNNSVVESFDWTDWPQFHVRISITLRREQDCNKLMAPGINSTDCVSATGTRQYAGVGNTAESRANINNKNPQAAEHTRSIYSNLQCASCQGVTRQCRVYFP